jgi:hypothetical protein
MRFEEFERCAWRDWERIPEEYRQGIDGLIVERHAVPHPSLSDIYTLGECVTESYPSDFGGPDTVRSAIVLYYGSFFRLSRLDSEFDWDAELWETLTHELQHHLESLAADDSLIDMDYAADENFKRGQGRPFDPTFYRHGEPVDGAWRVEDEFFIEVGASAGNADPRFSWAGEQYRLESVHASASRGGGADFTFIEVIDGVRDKPAALHVVIVARPGWRDMLRSLLGRRSPRITQLDARAVVDRRMAGEGGSG